MVTTIGVNNPTFATASESPALGYEVFSPYSVGISEHSGIPPLNVSTFEGFEAGREEFLTGARLLGLDTERKPIRPQQYVMADALNAQKPNGVPVHSVTAICVPRRASKTTSFWAIALGRISLREDYQVGWTAQTQVKARARWLTDVVKPLERRFPDPQASPFIINRQAGASFIECRATGSRISVLPPSAESFRGEGFALVGIDEGQEIEGGDESDDLVAGILPVFDTIQIDGESAGQLVLLGTAGDHQSGVFWDYLEKGRAGESGIVEYAADPDTTIHEEGEDIAGTSADPDVWKSAHPGIGNLTPLSVVAERQAGMTPRRFAQEYLGIWPRGGGQAFINAIKWDAERLDRTAYKLPEHFMLAFHVHIAGTSAAIAAAWRDENGVAFGAILEHDRGTRWLRQKVVALHRKHQQAFAYDAGNSMVDVEAQGIKQLRVARLRLIPQGWPHVSAAAALLMKEINDGTFRHFDQSMLNEAVAVAVKGQQKDSKRWSFRMTDSQSQDICTLEALALALRAFDEHKPRARLRPPGSKVAA